MGRIMGREKHAEGDLSPGFALEAGQAGGRRDEPAMKHLGGDAAVVIGRMQPAIRLGDSQAAFAAVGKRRKKLSVIGLSSFVNRPIAPGKASSKLARS